MGKPVIYMDYAATTPVAPEVLAAMEPYFTEKFYNPSAQYAAARAVRQDVEAARQRIARVLGARSSEIIFTAGGTEANNLAIRGVLQQYPGTKVIVSAIEHEAALAPARESGGTVVGVDANGRVNLAELERAVDDRTVLVSIMYASNEIGTIQPIREIGQLLEQLRQKRKKSGNKLPLYFHTDASQAASYLDLHASRLGVDLMTINGSKIYGPKQTGALFVKSHVTLSPQITGGGQERGLRSGTENVPGLIGLSVALELAQSQRSEEGARMKALQQLFEQRLIDTIPSAQINGSRKHRLPNNIHVTIPGQDNEKLVFMLDEQGILCASGSACSAAHEEPSHVLQAIGLDEASIRSSLRFTMGRGTTADDVETVVTTLKNCLS